jgi:hypothetical protein
MARIQKGAVNTHTENLAWQNLSERKMKDCRRYDVKK